MQTSYNQYNDPWKLGQIGDTGLRRVASFLAEGAVGLAKAVRRGTDKERQCVQAGTGVGQGALIIGISVMTQTLEQDASGNVTFADKTTVPVMRQGPIVVMTNDAVVAGSKVNFHLATGTFTDAAVAAGVEAMPGLTAYFETGTTAAGLALIRIRDTEGA